MFLPFEYTKFMVAMGNFFLQSMLTVKNKNHAFLRLVYPLAIFHLDICVFLLEILLNAMLHHVVSKLAKRKHMILWEEQHVRIRYCGHRHLSMLQ